MVSVGSGSSPTFDTDPDLCKLYVSGGSESAALCVYGGLLIFNSVHAATPGF